MLLKWSNLANEFMLVYSVFDPEVIQLKRDFKLGHSVRVCSSSIDRLRTRNSNLHLWKCLYGEMKIIGNDTVCGHSWMIREDIDNEYYYNDSSCVGNPIEDGASKIFGARGLGRSLYALSYGTYRVCRNKME